MAESIAKMVTHGGISIPVVYRRGVEISDADFERLTKRLDELSKAAEYANKLCDQRDIVIDELREKLHRMTEERDALRATLDEMKQNALERGLRG